VSIEPMTQRMAGWRQRLAETARRNRVELVDAGLTRRDLIKLGLVTGAGYLVTKLGLSSRAAGAGGPPRSPLTTPWVEELPVPPIASPIEVEALGSAPTQALNFPAGERGRDAPHQHWKLYEPVGADHYLIENRVALRSWHRELPLDTCWCFNGTFPGPRIHARQGRPVLLRFRNQLPSLDQHVGYGRPTPSTHVHNGHQASESDGHPLDTIEPGMFKDHLLLNRRAGFSDSGLGPGGDPRETLSTLWYHDQCLDFSAQNVYRGNVGLYHLFNEFDTGDENDPDPDAWRLPSGEFDVPLVFHDRLFDPEGKGFFDLFDLDGVLGDTVTVNGKIQPFLRVARRKYRFRALNVGPSRFYELSLSNGQPMVQLSRDGNLLPWPRTVGSVRLAVGNRSDLVLDFSGLPSGTELYLVNRQEQRDGRGPTGRTLPIAGGERVLKLVVDGSLDTRGDPSRVPDRFLDLPPVDLAEVVTERTFVLGRTNGGWTINGKPFDPDVITASPRQGTAEIWTFVNDSGAWTHPIHVHMEEHQVLSFNGQAPPAEEAAREDVVWLGPAESVKTFRRFRDFVGRHVTQSAAHGDHGLMFQWKVVP
jgi:FtsP/CotA-like multicopper oxidase with cupredoxin domain